MMMIKNLSFSGCLLSHQAQASEGVYGIEQAEGQISREKSKDANFMKRMKEKQFQGCPIEMEEQNKFYQGILGDLGIKDDQEESCDLKSTSYEHESNLSKQIDF
ncbi:hypothetical protein ABPG72_010889 [Tetrahymena utriculariae]